VESKVTLPQSRDEAWSLLTEWTKNESLRKHALAIEAAVRGYARLLDEDEHAWGTVALLHDLDYERHPTPGEHPFVGCEELRRRGFPEWAVRGRNGRVDAPSRSGESARRHGAPR
jgi:predicted hydrolase (HD superfamily)